MQRTFSSLMAIVALGMLLLAGQMASAQAPAQPGRAGAKFARIPAQQLNLTDAQREQARAIAQETRERMQQVLTAEQRQQVQQFQQRRGPRFQAGATLTPGQKAKSFAGRKHAQVKMRAARQQACACTQPVRHGDQCQCRARHDRMMGAGMQRKAFAMRPLRQPAGMGRTNLTPNQQAQLQTILQDGQAKFRAILTPEQQKTLDQMQAQHTGRFGRALR